MKRRGKDPGSVPGGRPCFAAVVQRPLAAIALMLLALCTAGAAQSPGNGRGLETSRRPAPTAIRMPDGSALPIRPALIRNQSGIETWFERTTGRTVLMTRDANAVSGYLLDALPEGSRLLNLVPLQSAAAMAPAPLAPSQVVPTEDDVLLEPQMISDFMARMQSRALSRANGALAAEGDLVVDVAFFYDESILGTHGRQWPHTSVQAAMDYMNAAFVMHGFPLSVRAVYVGPLPGGFSVSPLTTISSSAYAIDLANSFGADLIHGLFQHQGQGYCGIAYLVSRFGATSASCDTNRVIAHEIGHNLGMNHDRGNASPSGIAELDGFNYGYVCAGRGTIMSYPGAPHLPHYSSPQLSNGGVPCGIAEGSPEAAHNAHVLDLTAEIMADVRPPLAATSELRISGSVTDGSEEGNVPLVVEVHRSGDTTQEVSVDFATIDGTAAAGEDYVAGDSRLVFAPGETLKSIAIPLLDDDHFEGAEAFQAVLRYPKGATLVTSAVDLTVTSGDPDRGLAQFTGAGVSVWESAGELEIAVRRIGPTEASLDVAAETFDISAKANVDYTPVSTTVHFAPGESATTVRVRVIDDSGFQGYNAFRQFGIRLTGNVAAPSSYTVSIFNDDLRRGTVGFARPTIEVSEAGQQVVARLTRSEGSEGPLTVNFTARPGSAVATRDFIATTGSVTFQDKQVTAAAAVMLLDNFVHDGPREFQIAVANGNGGESVTTVIILDDDPDLGKARFPSLSYTVPEADRKVIIEVLREGSTERELPLVYQTYPGTAKGGLDYTAQTGNLVFGVGETRKTMEIAITADPVQEPQESFSVFLFGEVVGAAAVTVNIVDSVQLALGANSGGTAGSVSGSASAASPSKAGGGNVDLLLLAALAWFAIARIRQRRTPV